MFSIIFSLYIFVSLILLIGFFFIYIKQILFTNLFFKNYIFLLILSIFTFFIFLFSLFIYTNNNLFIYLNFYKIDYFFNNSIYNIILNKSVFLSESFFIYFPFLYSFIFITLLTLLFCFAYNKKELLIFIVFVILILIIGLLLFLTNSIIYFFLIYESLLLPSFFILYKFAKTRKAVEASFLMFFWTQFGALFLILNFQYLFFLTNSFKFSNIKYINFNSFELHFLLITSLIGFGVKFPIWPFYDWLPKAHVEASTNFSIFLSGVLVKFAFFGFFKYILLLNLDLTSLYLYPFLIIGLLDSSLKLFYQIDLKKVIAYSTVVEMHWLLIALVSGINIFWIPAAAMLLSHAILSSSLFLSIDYVTRRFKTRLTTEISGIYYFIPDLYLLTLVILIIFLGFPGTLFFLAEFLFFSFLLDINFILFFFIFIIIYLLLPISFIKNWFLLLFSYNSPIIISNTIKFNTEIFLDLTLLEKFILFSFILQLFWLGFSFQYLFF